MREILRLRESFSGFYIGSSHGYEQFVALLNNFLTLDPDVQKMGIHAD
jgi:hypothetical protein